MCKHKRLHIKDIICTQKPLNNIISNAQSYTLYMYIIHVIPLFSVCSLSLAKLLQIINRS